MNYGVETRLVSADPKILAVVPMRGVVPVPGCSSLLCSCSTLASRDLTYASLAVPCSQCTILVALNYKP